MSWQDKMREGMYFQDALRANNAADLDRRIESTDKFVDGVSNFFNGIGRQPSPPPPPPKTSSGGSLGGLLALGALAGGAYLLNKAFGSSDKQKNTAKTANNSN